MDAFASRYLGHVPSHSPVSRPLLRRMRPPGIDSQILQPLSRAIAGPGLGGRDDPTSGCVLDATSGSQRDAGGCGLIEGCGYELHDRVKRFCADFPDTLAAGGGRFFFSPPRIQWQAEFVSSMAHYNWTNA